MRKKLVGRQMSASAAYGLKAEHFKPKHDQILIEIMEPGKTPGGLHLPEGHSSDLPMGVVRAVGPGHVNADGTVRPPCVAVGDVVLFGNGALMIPGTNPPLGFIRDREAISEVDLTRGPALVKTSN